MTIRRRVVFFTVIAAGAAALTLSAWQFRGASSTQNGAQAQTLLNPNVRLDEALRASGFAPRFVEIFSSVTTDLVSSSNGRYHIAQRQPALSLRRDVRIAIHTDRRLMPGQAMAARAAAGFDVYPLHHAVVRSARGYDRYQAFFVAYDALGPELLDRLGLQRRAGRRRDWNILPVAHAQSAMLGIVVASVTTTTGDSGGVGATGASGRTQQPTLSEQELRQQETDARRQQYLDEHYDGSLDDYNKQRSEYRQQFEDSLDSETRERLQQGEDLRLESAQSEIELNNLLREGETLAQKEARVTLERDAARLQKAGSAVAILGMLAEWMQQALDFRDWAKLLDAAEKCLDQRARNAGPEERANIEQVREQLRAARSDMNWNTGVRVVNSGNAAVGSAVIPGAAGAALGLASSGNNAALRDLTAQSLADAIRGVGNCDPPPCPEPPAETSAASTQDHSPGLSRVAPATAPLLVCLPAQARIVVNAEEADGRTITFESVVNLSNSKEPATNFGREFSGKGKGPYREQFVSEQCSFTITWSGEVDVTVLANVEGREVNVDIGGPVTQSGEWPGESCLAGTYYAPNRPLPAAGLGYSCRFDNVDFTRGGVYRGPPPEEESNPYGCTLHIGPLISPQTPVAK
jgi:hypothetical protein